MTFWAANNNVLQLALVPGAQAGGPEVPPAYALSGYEAVGALNTKAADDLGFRALSIQESIADLARTDYKSYIQQKKGAFEQVKNDTIAHYVKSATRWKNTGMPDEESLKLARKDAEIYRDTRMQQFHRLYRNSGKKVEEQY